MQMKYSRGDVLAFLVTTTLSLLMFWGIDLLSHNHQELFVRVLAVLLAASVGLGVVWGRRTRRKERKDGSSRN